jgi:hypothetical protein
MKRLTKYLLPVLGLAACVVSAASAQFPPNPITAASTGLDRGYFDMYDVNFAAAHTIFQQLLAQHPDDALAAGSDAAAYLFGEFDRLHIIDVELFADQSRFDGRSRLIPDPAVRKAFDDRSAQAARLADAAIKRNPRDATAFYVKTMVCGMQSDYALMIDRRDLAALNLTKQAAVYSRQALALNPTMYDAYLASPHREPGPLPRSLCPHDALRGCPARRQSPAGAHHPGRARPGISGQHPLRAPTRPHPLVTQLVTFVARTR